MSRDARIEAARQHPDYRRWVAGMLQCWKLNAEITAAEEVLEWQLCATPEDQLEWEVRLAERTLLEGT